MVNKHKTNSSNNPAKLVLILTGTLFLVAGLFFYNDPSALQEFIKLDEQTSRFLPFVLMFIGAADIVMAMTLFRGKDKV